MALYRPLGRILAGEGFVARCRFLSVAVKELDGILSLKNRNTTNWIVEAQVETLCNKYVAMEQEERAKFLSTLAKNYAVNHEKVLEASKKLVHIEPCPENRLIGRERSLRDALTPPYQQIFTSMGRLENGVKFLVDLRADLLELIMHTPRESEDYLCLSQLNLNLRDLLLMWFSVGFLHVERITWQTSCDILQKVSDYEAIHPMRNWLDLKKRVGAYRRCYIFTHPSMPREPLVVLHTALCDIIPETVAGIKESEMRMRGITTNSYDTCQDLKKENKLKIKAAIFYSIASTQVGLQGIELGNYLIKEVAKQVTNEFPIIDQLSTLSPIPNFRTWLLDKIKQDPNNIFTRSEQEAIESILTQDSESEGLYLKLKRTFNNSLWGNDEKLVTHLKEPLMRACAWYLYREKRRRYALNNVANFHLRNGAVMWRLNWLADPSPRGMANSCGIMVNYRYFLDDAETNSRRYIEEAHIPVSDCVSKLAFSFDKLHAIS